MGLDDPAARLMSLANAAGLAVVTVNQVTVKPDPGG